MATNAKITLSADVAGLKQKVGEARKLLTDLGSVKIDDGFAKSLKDGLSKELANDAKRLEKEISGIGDALKAVGAAGEKAFDDSKIKQQLQSMAEMHRRLKDIRDIQKQMGSGGGDTGGGGGGGGSQDGGGGLSGLMSMIPGGRLTKMLTSAIGVGTVTALVQKRMNIAQERLGAKALTGGALAARGSGFGFTEPERRQRTMDIARAVGRDMSGKEITAMVNQGELFERTHGVSSGTQGSLTGAVRRSGGDSVRAMSTAMKAAQGAGFTGGKVTEFLQSMAENISQMSQGVNIDTDSLMGFAGALSTLPFFKDDPARAGRAAQSLNQAFQSGDRFQQALVARTMNGTAGGGLNPAEIEVRKGFGLFGKPSKGFLDLPGMGGVKKSFSDKPGVLIEKLFKEVMRNTEGLPEPVRFEQFRSAMNLEAGVADPIFTRLAGGKGLRDKDIAAAEKGAKTPAERLEATFSGLDKNMGDLSANISRLTEALADEVAVPVGDLSNVIRKALLPGDAETAYLKEKEAIEKEQMGSHMLKLTGGKIVPGLMQNPTMTKGQRERLRAAQNKRAIMQTVEGESGFGSMSYDINAANAPSPAVGGMTSTDSNAVSFNLPFLQGLERVAVATEKMSKGGKKIPEGSRVVSEVAYGN